MSDAPSLTNRPRTRLGICPFSLHVNPLPTVQLTNADGSPKAVEQKIDLCACVGSACHLWQFEVGSDPATGDCALNIAAQGAALTANLMHRMFSSQAAQSEQPVESPSN